LTRTHTIIAGGALAVVVTGAAFAATVIVDPVGPLDFALHRARYERVARAIALDPPALGTTGRYDSVGHRLRPEAPGERPSGDLSGEVHAMRASDGTLGLDVIVVDRHHAGTYRYLYVSNGAAPDAYVLGAERASVVDQLGVDNCAPLRVAAPHWWAARCGD
jgi:hypothetical protein